MFAAGRWRQAFSFFSLAALALGMCLQGEAASAQTDEIQVYNAEIAAPGVLNLTLDDNYTPEGRFTPSFPAGVTPNHDLNGVPEFGYGVTWS